MTRAAKDRLVVAAVALAARVAVIVWAGADFPAAADGTYYQRIAERVAAGQGYTWVWPDGAVTFAAHYPIGYPAILAVFYRLLGASVVVGSVVNALFGVAMAVAAYDLVRTSAFGTRAARVAGGLVAIHPALVPYTLAIMTEGPTAALLVVAAAAASRARISPPKLAWRWRLAAGIALGVATLVRPQSLVLAPVFGWLSVRRVLADRIRATAAVGAIAVACCLPWTVRNCVHMHRCALVSVNAGWNLHIGDATESGAWQPIEVPDECKTVWDEAAKDACFEAAAKRKILQDKLDFVAKMPAKLGVTFDYFGGAPWYLHESNAKRFDDDAKVALGTVETVFSRIVLAVALASLAWLARARSPVSLVVAIVGLPFAFLRHAWPGYLALAFAILAWRRMRTNVALASSAWTILATAVTHAVFFGAGRYGLVSSAFVVVVCASAGVGSFLAKPRPSLPTASFKNSFSRS